MGSYETFLSRVDGMPGLVPFRPEWPYDPQKRRELCSKLPNGGMIAMMAGGSNQRDMDSRWKHFIRLVKNYEGEDKRPSRDWVDLLCTPSGWDGSALRNGPRCTVRDQPLLKVRRFADLSSSFFFFFSVHLF